MEFVWCFVLIYSVVFLCIRLLRIFEDSGKDYIDRGVDRVYNLGGCIFLENRSRVDRIGIWKNGREGKIC